MVIKGTTRLLGVIGHPVEHSFSPLMHNAAIAHLQQNSGSHQPDYAYLPFPIRPEKLKEAIAGFEAIDLHGFNITIPHKQAIIPLLDDVSEVAKAIGAVNTVWRDKDGWHGTNTDAYGFLAPLKALSDASLTGSFNGSPTNALAGSLTASLAGPKDWSNARALILGNGGAARAVVAACQQLGCARISVVGRSPDKLAYFAESWAHAPHIASRLKVMTWDELPTQLPKTDLIVNATPLGMHPKTDVSPLSEAEIEMLKPGAIAYDLIYTPRPTKFLQQATTAGFLAIDGLEMLVQQGAAALEIWLAQPAPVDIMRQTLLDYLGQSRGQSSKKLLQAKPR